MNAGRAPAVRRSRAGRRSWIILAVILACGALLRVLYLTESRQWPEFAHPAVDAQFHDHWARGLAFDDWTPPDGFDDLKLGETPFFRPPGYPYFLAAIYYVFGPNYLAPRVAQMALGLASAVVAFLIGRRWFSNRVGLFAAAGRCGYWSFIYFEGQLLEPTLLVFLTLLMTYAIGRTCERGSYAFAILAGVIIGLAGLVRTNALVWLVCALAWVLWHVRPRIRKLTASAVLLSTAAATIAPATIWNFRRSGEFILVSTNAGINLYIGNNEKADGFFLGQVEGLGRFGTCFHYPALARNLGRMTGKPVTYPELSRHLADRALDYMLDHPWRTITLATIRAYTFWAPYEISDNRVVAYDRWFSKVLGTLPGNFAAVFSGAVVGFAGVLLSKRARQFAFEGPHGADLHVITLLTALSLAYAATFLLFFNTARFRVPVTAFLLIGAALAADFIVRCVRLRRMQPALAVIALWLAMYFTASIAWVPYRPSLAEWYYARGLAFAKNADPENSALALAKTLELEPENPEALIALGKQLIAVGDTEAGLGRFRQALALAPDRPDLHEALASEYLELGAIPQAMKAYEAAVALASDSVATYQNLGTLLSEAGRHDEALQVFQHGLDLRPTTPELHMGLGIALGRAGRWNRAEGVLREALHLDPASVLARLNLGLALKELGRPDEALQQYDSALQQDPANPMLMHNIGIIHYEADRTRLAAEWFRRALRYDPDLVLTRYWLAMALKRQGQLQEAIVTVEGVLARAPGHAAARFLLGEMLERQGRFEAALEQYRLILAHDPNDAEAADRVSALEKR